MRVSAANRAGLPFWSAAVEEYTRGEFTESGVPEPLMVGACLPSRAPMWAYEPSNKRLQPTAAGAIMSRRG